MPKRESIERVLPCLLDRLSDDHPKQGNEGRNERVISLSRYKEGVLRDLRWLFNSMAHIDGEPITEDEILASSVLNYGLRNLSGLVADSIDVEAYRRHIVDCLKKFEPRLNPNTIEVRLIQDPEKSGKGVPTLHFEISGELWARPVPERFLARTEMDLETGECIVV